MTSNVTKILKNRFQTTLSSDTIMKVFLDPKLFYLKECHYAAT